MQPLLSNHQQLHQLFLVIPGAETAQQGLPAVLIYKYIYTFDLHYQVTCSNGRLKTVYIGKREVVHTLNIAV